ncbi:SIR2 family protein [Stenotrophomonas maltophilia]|uniref:SIR2 family protein n=1 Tax=Stenotrophomonas maltophilia TaxID=40324 RepID=UPI0021C6505C|nr:SIR2 family protein [Stenotrophomonas maltophilia]MCU1023371.1 SIR2 family protein [Stenotrophomonas maltophilia]
MTKSIQVISASKFATTFALRPELHAWLLGAGASAASGIPTGYDMILDFKARLYCQETRFPRRNVDPSDPLWVQRIDEFFTRTPLLPPPNDPTEYAAAFEAIYPQETHRRQYIADAISKGTPCFGHRMLAGLISASKAPCVFTTNFDPLIEESSLLAASLMPPGAAGKPTVATLDSAHLATRCLDESDWPLIAKLHGDYRSTSLKNTTSELASQDHDLRRAMVEACKRFSLVVVGYSGRDSSVMEALESVLAYENPFPSGLYWCASSRAKLLPAVKVLLEKAASKGVNVFIIESATFDELAGDLLNQINLPAPLLDHVLSFQPAQFAAPVPVRTAEARKFPVLRLSALPVESLPTTARRVALGHPASIVEVREMLKATKCRSAVAMVGNELAAFGKDAEILTSLQSLKPVLNGHWALDPAQDSWALGLIYDALLRALARRRPLIPRLKRSGHSLLVASARDGETEEQRQRRESQLAKLKEAYGGKLTGQIYGRNYNEGISVRLEEIEGRWWCGFDPYTAVEAPRDERPTSSDTAQGDPLGWSTQRRPDPTADWRRERWATKYNGPWANIIAAWAGLLTSPRGVTFHAFGIEDQEGVDAAFRISPLTGFSRPGHHDKYFDRRQ